MKKEIKGMKLKCKRKDCLHEWNYKGERKFYATCPNCHSNVKINRDDKGGKK